MSLCPSCEKFTHTTISAVTPDENRGAEKNLRQTRYAVFTSLIALGLVAAPSCKPQPAAPRQPPPVNAPYELANDDDLDAEIDRWTSLTGPARSELGRRLAAELASRFGAAVDRDQRPLAFSLLKKLVSIARTPSGFAQPPPWLVNQRPAIAKLRAKFAQAGKDNQAVSVLFVLAWIDPDEATNHLGEVDSIFGYSNELAKAEFGIGSKHSRTISILEFVAAATPLPEAIYRLLPLYLERQLQIAKTIRTGGLTYEIIGAHGQGVLQTTFHVVRVAVIARDLEAAFEFSHKVAGFGDDDPLKAAVAAAVSETASATDYLALASFFEAKPKNGDEREDTVSLPAALAIVELGRERFPNDLALTRRAGMIASSSGLHSLARRDLAAGQPTPPTDRIAANELAELYEFRISRLTARGSAIGARQVLLQFEDFFAKAVSVWPDFVPDLANAYAARGQGLLSLGQLSAAEAVLHRSLSERPTLEAFESLGTAALRTNQFEAAARFFLAALELPVTEPSVQFNHNKLMRLAGEALLGAGYESQAESVFVRALGQWNKMRTSETYELRPPFSAEALIESAKLLWHLDKREAALAAFGAAQDAAPKDANTYSSTVAFLVLRGHYDQALDAYHRGLGTTDVSEYSKVYMSLWMLAESRRQARPDDPFVREFLGSRRGRLWFDDLARFASGRTSLGQLKKRATTAPRRAELLYYSAVLAPSDRNEAERKSRLRDVIDSDMIMFFEYEMAKHWLKEGFSRRELAPKSRPSGR